MALPCRSRVAPRSAAIGGFADLTEHRCDAALGPHVVVFARVTSLCEVLLMMRGSCGHERPRAMFGPSPLMLLARMGKSIDDNFEQLVHSVKITGCARDKVIDCCPLSLSSTRASIGTENPIPEEMDHCEIAVCMPMMNEV
jgi:hypothetical protein